MAVLTRIILVLTISLVNVNGHHKHDHDKDKHDHHDHHDAHEKHPKPILPDMARLSDPAHVQDKPTIPNLQEHGSSSFGNPSIPGLSQNAFTNTQWSSNIESRAGSDEDEPVGTINNPYHTEWKQESHTSYNYHSPQGSIEKNVPKLAEQGVNKESDKTESSLRKFSDEAKSVRDDKKRKRREVTKENALECIIYPDENDNEEPEAKTNDNKGEPSQENDNTPLINKSRDVNNVLNRNAGSTVVVPVQFVSSTTTPLPNIQLSDSPNIMPSNKLSQPQLQSPNYNNQGMNSQNAMPINNVMPNPNSDIQNNLYTNQPNAQIQYNVPQGSQNYPNSGNSFQNSPLNNGGVAFVPNNNQLLQPQYFQGQDGNAKSNVINNGAGNYPNADQYIILTPPQYVPNNNAYQPNDNQIIQGIPLPYNNPNGNQINPSNTGSQSINSFPNNIQVNGENYNLIPLNNWPNQNNVQNPTGQYMPLNNVAMNGNQLPPNQGNIIYLKSNGQNVQPTQGNMYLVPQNNLPNNNLGQGYLYMGPLQNNKGVNMGNGQGSSPTGYQVANTVPVYNVVPLNNNNNGNLAMTRDEANEDEE